jgi:hypothetical protein
MKPACLHGVLGGDLTKVLQDDLDLLLLREGADVTADTPVELAL